ncbi:drebrin-like protein A isoform X3 [Carassius gibelio]|uniref:drebrin-like protein A isoform X3 n=1 Tax=Carassius gibelio TaxID=101364 RepID=UPI0022795CC8|nr:drebrin-like protein A isoform X3 [Carassius gibelio]
MRAINLDAYSLSLLTAKEDILNPRASTNWALFTYEGVTNNLKLTDSGAGGLAELVGKFHSSWPMYGLCRVGLTETGQPQIVMVCWVGNSVDEIRRTECVSHVPAIKTFFKEAQVFITASEQDEVTEEQITAAFAKIRPPMERLRRTSRTMDEEETVGTNYKKTNAAMEMRRINRDSFWARAEREEEERKEEERRRTVEERRRWERERILQEKKEAEERERKMSEKLQMIEEQKVQAQLEEEAEKEEKARWEQQKRELEEDMRARLRRSESIEKAAEAAALVSQRTINPREFFRQLSASSQNSSSPGSPRLGKSPFRRYQRSLTDTAFIFERANSTSGSTSPLSPSARSPFSRSQSTSSKCPPSPLSPPYRTIPSPQRPQTSPPTSPSPCSVPPVSPLPSLPVSRAPPLHRPPPQAPVHHPASPASPQLLDSQEKSVSHNYDISEELAVRTERPPTSLTENPLHTMELVTSSRDLCEPKPGVEFTAKAVLVEEDEEEVEELKEPSAMSAPPSDTHITTNYEEAVEEPEDVQTLISPLVEVEELEEPQSESEEEPEEQPSAESEELQANVDHLEPEEPRHVVPITDDEVEEDLPESQESCVNASEYDVMNEEGGSECGRPLNGTVEDVDMSERHCYTVNREEEDDNEIQTEVVTENGKSSPERLLRVRALYDYQAEDDTELSFEPGDIISDVETVDKAWWRGSSKDGRQGLFPANYVETI